MAFIQSDIGYLPIENHKIVRILCPPLYNYIIKHALQALSGLAVTPKPDAEMCLNALTFLFK